MSDYSTECTCGREICFKSNQPPGSVERIICDCFRVRDAVLPGPPEKFQYKTRAETLRLQEMIIDVLADISDVMTLRQIYYRLVSAGCPKTEEFYNKVQRTLLDLRERNCIPFDLIADNSRSFYKPRTYSSLERMLEAQQQFYRRDLWQDQDTYVEIWLEKEALRSVFWDITEQYQVPMYVTKGVSSVSFLHSAAQTIKEIGKQTFIYLFSDYDPTGLVISRSIEKRLKEFGVTAEFVRAGLTRDQIEEYSVTTRPTKDSKHSAGFIGESAELDALHPRILKSIVRNCIEGHVSREALERLKGIESAERETLSKILNNLRYAS